MNKIKVWNKKKHLYEDKDCNCKLWKPLTKEELIDSDWIKLGKEGWLLKSHVVSLYDK